MGGSRVIRGGLVLHDCDETVVLADDDTRDLEQLVSPARNANRLGQSREACVVGIERHREIRADVGPLLARGETAFTRTAETRSTLATLAAAKIAAALSLPVTTWSALFGNAFTARLALAGLRRIA